MNNFRSKAISPSPLSFYLFWIAQSSIIFITRLLAHSLALYNVCYVYLSLACFSSSSLDYDPISKPDSLPLSCVQRFITDATRKETPPQFIMVSAGSVESLDRASNVSERVEVKRKIAIKHHSYSMSSSNRSNTPTGKFGDNCKLTKKSCLYSLALCI